MVEGNGDEGLEMGLGHRVWGGGRNLGDKGGRPVWWLLPAGWYCLTMWSEGLREVAGEVWGPDPSSQAAESAEPTARAAVPGGPFSMASPELPQLQGALSVRAEVLGSPHPQQPAGRQGAEGVAESRPLTWWSRGQGLFGPS